VVTARAPTPGSAPKTWHEIPVHVAGGPDPRRADIYSPVSLDETEVDYERLLAEA
jgi:hypothetical protein